MVVRHSPHGAALFGVLREHHQADHQQRGNDAGHDIQVVDKEPVAKGVKGGVVDPGVQPLRQPHIHRLDVGPPHQIAHPFQKIGQTDGRHEEDDRLLPDQMAEDQPLHRIGQPDHHHHRQQNREERRHVPAEMVNIRAQDRVDQVAKRHLPINDPCQG